MKKILVCLSILLSMSLLIAVQIDLPLAKLIAAGFVDNGTGTKCLINSTEDFMMESSSNPDLFIVRFEPRGFVLVAGDTRSYPILGYSLSEVFPEGALPAHVQWYLKQYSLSMAEIRQHPEWQDDPAWQLVERGDYTAWQFDRDVAPILTTTWNQNWPYNSMCPSDTQGPGGHVYAGCVATAMGQVMKKWNYPVTGSGSHSYTATGYGTQSANFGATTYNWGSMPNSTSSVNTAISTLLYHCGVAVDMQYAADGSGAYSEDARDALVNYFRYNSAAQLLTASSYSATTWASMIRGDLDLGRPVYYAGQGAEGGHAFVLDGYQGTNYFHFNWGWSGSYNGYFYLSNLNPGSHSFNQNQRGLLYLYPLNTTTNDLAASSLTGPSTIMVNQAGTFTATVTNAGTAAQSSYTVKLMRDTGVQLASTSGSSIAPGATQTYQLSWTPTPTGNYSLYAMVSLSTDTNAANNQSPTLPVAVTPNATYEPPTGVTATASGSTVNVSWTAPGGGTGQWIHYDSGSNNDTIGTNGAADFDIAIRYPGSALTAYAGMSLRAVKVWPAESGTYAARVWTGGSATAPGTMVTDQAFTPVLDSYNTVILTNPIPINTSQELWFGMRCNVNTGYPAGCDAGPAVDGFGNMIYFNGAWSTLLALASALNYNWNIQGFIGYGAPASAPIISGTKYIPFPALADVNPRFSSGCLQQNPDTSQGDIIRDEPSRVLNGYKVWRLISGNQNNEATWTSLTPSYITSLNYMDTSLPSLPAGNYMWAVKAVYDASNYSAAAFSNAITIGSTGSIAGIVRNQQNQPILGATITCSPYSTTTNNAGAYSLTLPFGTYNVTASHPNYTAVTQNNVAVVTGQTTTLNFVLPNGTTLLNDGFETYPDFATTFAPWTCVDVDQSTTYNMSGTTWPGSASPMAYMVFNPASATPPITTFSAHTGTKMAVAIASTTPPNNDWLITPLVSNPIQFRFWARSLTNQYGLERFKVGISTTGTNPAGFTIISGANYLQAPVEWTEYIYDVSSYNGNAYLGIQCVSNDAWFFMVDDVIVTSDGSSPDPFGNPAVLPSSMTVVAGVTINGQQASSGDVLAAYVTENGTPQLRGKQAIQVVDGIAGCVLQVYTITNGETISFKVWDQSTDTIFNSPTTLPSTVNGSVGSWPANLFMINTTPNSSQNIILTSGWNLVSLNVSPANHSIANLISGISGSVQQIKGTDGIYIPGNPYSTLTSLADGNAYSIQMSNPANWSVNESAIPVSTPISLNDGWNMVAYLPQSSMSVSAAMASIASWVQQVKGTDGVYIPDNPYSSLTTLYPGKGYWIKVSGAHNLIYPSRAGSLGCVSSPTPRQETLPDLRVANKATSATALVKCTSAKDGDTVLARIQGELRGKELLLTPEGFPAALIQIYCDTSEVACFSLLKPDGSEIPLRTTLIVEPNATYGNYPNFLCLEPATMSGEEALASDTRLLACYPNPFNPNTQIAFHIGKDITPVTLNIFNIKGQVVRHLSCRSYEKGEHSVLWDGKDDNGQSVSSGVYFATFQTNNLKQQIKMLLTK